MELLNKTKVNGSGVLPTNGKANPKDLAVDLLYLNKVDLAKMLMARNGITKAELANYAFNRVKEKIENKEFNYFVVVTNEVALDLAYQLNDKYLLKEATEQRNLLQI